MVCPLCITAAIVANAPAIAAAASGAAAAKLAYDKRGGILAGAQRVMQHGGRNTDSDRPQVSRVIVDPRQLPPVVTMEDEEW